jgi:hypothetical protein
MDDWAETAWGTVLDLPPAQGVNAQSMSSSPRLMRTARAVVLVLCSTAAVLGAPALAAAQPVVATITYPANGVVNADMSQAIQWTAVANVQAYYLYVGTTPGAKDLVNTGETQQTSYLAVNLPIGPTLYARLWTKVGGVWAFVDSTFTAGAAAPVVTATITDPANGAPSADLTLPIRWTSVANVQTYYLYVGSGVGLKDLLDTGETLQTSWLSTNLPSGQTLYARLWTKVAGVWRFVDSTFTAAPPQATRLTFPANGAAGADLSQAIRWLSVENVQAYYLYVGTAVGLKDLVNTGETLQTSYLASGLPAGQTLYARMWTKVGGVWRYNDSTFSAAAPVILTATLTSPLNGATSVDMSQPMRWTTVTNAQAYYLYVGTTLGANNVVNTGETLQTSYLAANVPAGQTLYARMWTRVGGVWRYVDTTFTAAPSVPLTATLTSPVDGTANWDQSQLAQWTTVAQAQVYYLYVGSSVGAKNLVDSQELQQTSYHITTELPSGQTLYARLWTKAGGVWRYVDSTFSAAPLTAVLTNPTDGASGTDPLQPATWTSVPNVQAYYLYVGSSVGIKDIVDGGETLHTTTSIATVPAGTTLYARLWTKVAGVWRYRDSTFTATKIAPTFVYPTDGAASVDVGQPFQWTAPVGTDANRLKVGTTPGASDLFDSGETAATSITVPGLPTSGVLYAQAASRVHGLWRLTDAAFTSASSATPMMIAPVAGDLAFNATRPFEWADLPLARGYRLTIGTTLGGSDLHDSGEIHVTQRFVPNLPLGPLFGRLAAKIAGQWQSTDFTFSVVANGTSPALQIKSAEWATDVVRSMALSDNHAFSWTALSSVVFPRLSAVCSDYAQALLRVLAEMNVQLTSRQVDVAMNPNGYDVHSLVEMLDPESNRWLLLDPTFDVTMTRTSTGEWATAEDMSAATQSLQWNDISYTFLGSLNDFYLRGYYVDYPLLFANVYHAGQTMVPGQGATVLPYLQQMPLPISGTPAMYVVGCTGTTQAELLVDGVVQTLACDGVDGLSYVFGAGSISTTAQTIGVVTLYRPARFVF